MKLRQLVPVIALAVMFCCSFYGNEERSASRLTIGIETPDAPEKPLLAFAVISDIHIQAWHKPSHQKLLKALNDLNGIKPRADALVVNGDMTNGQPADYAVLNKLFADAPHPRNLFFSIGNHEYYKAWFDWKGAFDRSGFPHGETEADSIARFLALTGERQVYYEKTVNGFPFLFLGSERYRQSDPTNGEDAYLTPQQLDWLQASLLKHKNNKRIFVFLHQPLPNTLSGTAACCLPERAAMQHERLKNTLAQYPQAVLFTGHTHRELKLPAAFVRDKFAMVGSSSVAAPLTDNGSGGELELAPDASEGLFVEVYDDRLLIRGRDFRHGGWIPEAEFEID